MDRHEEMAGGEGLSAKRQTVRKSGFVGVRVPWFRAPIGRVAC